MHLERAHVSMRGSSEMRCSSIDDDEFETKGWNAGSGDVSMMIAAF